MAVFENISHYAEKRNVSIAELEKRSGLGNGTIGKWKNSKPSLNALEKVAKELSVKVSTLLKE